MACDFPTRLARRWRVCRRAFSLSLLFALPFAASTHAQAPVGETLYNGIQLPAAWPPQPAIYPVYNPTPPYLVAPPAVIPIDVGRQLFVDDFLIQSTTMTRTFHQPVYHPSNPLVFPDRPWEGDFALAYSDGVFYDPADQLFKMWYMAGLHDHTALAVSTNGITWDKPNFNVVAGTNVVMPGGSGRDSNSVWLDHYETDPAKRFKTAWWWVGMHLSSSADGIHWGPKEFSSGRTGDRSTFFFNPFRRKWVFSLRSGDATSQELLDTRRYGRVRRYAEGATLLQAAQSWPTDIGDHTLDNLPKWLSSDIEDRPTRHPDFNPQLYNLDAAAYESLFVGFFTILTADTAPDRPKINEVSLGYSRDGFNFSRPDRRPFFPVSEDPSAWNYGNVQSTAGGGIVVGDEIYFYLTGRTNDTAATGLAVLRRDGFASMDAGSSASTLVTRPVSFAGKYLFVNANMTGGDLCAEVLDQNNQVIAPFTSANCVPVTSGGTARQITWAGALDLSALSGQPVKFRFTMRHGELYAFWVSPDTTGASYGYLTAGGPGLPGGVDTVGVPASSVNLPPSVSVTAPTGGSVVNEGTAVALRANASDPGGSVTRVDFYVDGQQVATDATSPYEATWTATSAGPHSVTAVAVDNLNAATTSAAVPVSVVAVPTGSRVNVALASFGSTATASSSINANYGPSAAIDGRRSGAGRGLLGTWEDATAYTPDWIQVTFAAPATIDEVDVFSLQVNSATPVEPTPTLTSILAAADFSVQDWDGAGWVVAPGGQVVGNTLVWRRVTLSPVTTTAIRIVVTNVWGGGTRLTEVEAYTSAVSRPTASLTAAPATITSGDSSTLSWTTSGASSVSIDQGVGSVASSGSTPVAPGATTTYTLTATNAAGPTTSTAVVTVNVPPPVNTPPQVSVTAPTGGSVVTTGAAVTLRATASDPGGSVARVDFYVDAQLVASDATNTYEITWTATTVGPHSVTAVAVDNLSAATTSAAVAVSVAAVPTGNRVNVALAASGATATASSSINANYGPSAAIDGRRSGAGRGLLGTWEDATAYTPDWIQVTFAAPATIDEVDVFSLQVNSATPVEPTPTLTSFLAAGDFSVQSWDGAGWVVAPGGQVVGNTLVWRQVTFSPVTTTAIRIMVTQVWGGATRLTEVEAWTPESGASNPTATLTAVPSTITSGGSSTLSWTTSGASSVSIDQGVGSVASSGSTPVAPGATTTYTLTATNAAGPTTSTAVVTVNAPPPVNTPPQVSVTAPTGGSVVNEGTAVALRANASDPGGSVARVDFYVDAQQVATDATDPYEGTWTATTVGPHSVTAVAVDNLNATTTSAAVAVSVAAVPTGNRVNVALAASGATATASSSINANYGPSAAIDGRRSGAGRGLLGTWEDATAYTPDWIQVTFAAPATIDEVDVFSLQVNSATPVEPTPTLTSFLAAGDFSVQYWDGAAWVVAPGGQVVGNTLVWRQVTFSPVTTTAIRIVVTNVWGGGTRLTEVEAWTVATAP